MLNIARYFLTFLEVDLEEARQKFEALIEAKGRDAPAWSGSRYLNNNIQTYWRWFYLGWTMTKGNT